MHGQSEPRTTATPSRAREGSRRETKAQDKQGNAKTKNTKEQEGEVDAPGKALAEAASEAPARALPGRPTWPRQEPCRGNLPNTSKTTTLEPESLDAVSNV